MESFRVIRASAFRALRPWLFDKIVPLELATAVKQEYGFIQAPSDASQLNQPVDFHAGKFKYDDQTVAIEQFFVAYVGNKATSLGASTRLSSDASEAFLGHVIDWTARQYGLDKTEVLPRAYFSQVEFVLSKTLSTQFLEFKGLSDAITEFVKGYGLTQCPPYELTGFSINFDFVKYDNLKPTPQPFAIERRAGAAFDENKYFSQAPLRTQDHKVVLEKLERILSR
jgi:hypothetical protein